jgi:acetyl-CoA acetyltransferase
MALRQSEMKAKYGTDSMGETAENVAEQYKITRGDQDALALRSQKKAAEAERPAASRARLSPSRFRKRKAIPNASIRTSFSVPIRPLELLAKLKPAFRATGGTVTAGTRPV